MGTITDRVERMSVRAISPDGTVRATLTFRGVTVELRPGAAERHTDRSLAAQTEAALTGVFTGYERAVEQIRSDAAGGRPPDAVEDLPETHPRRRLDALASGLEVPAYSTEDFVSLGWRGKKEFRVELRPGTVRRLSDAELAAELTSVVANAARERARRLREIHRELRRTEFR